MSDFEDHVDEISGATYTHCDVTKWDNLLDMHELAIKEYGTIDVVVPNAGINEVEDIFEDKFDATGRLLAPKHVLNEVNLKGVVNSISSFHFCILILSGKAGYPLFP
jgi:short-subunit dehydrogenase involved in D-alanine esterification of teichoic acids